jgi:hypothetical protein
VPSLCRSPGEQQHALRDGKLGGNGRSPLGKGQFNVHNIKLREPPELDFAPEEPRTLSDLVSLHVNEMGYSLGDLSKMLVVNESEMAKTYSIGLPGQEKGRGSHLRIIQ